MRRIDARDCSLAPLFIRQATKDVEGIDHVEMHPAQEDALENIGITVISTVVSEVQHSISDELFEKKVGGWKLRINSSLPKTSVIFVGKHNEPLAVISNLAIPNGY